MAENETTVKLEVDMEPLKKAFENVSTGFKEQGQSIRKLQLTNIVLAGLLTGNFLLDWLIR